MYDNKVDVVSLEKKKVVDRIATEMEPLVLSQIQMGQSYTYPIFVRRMFQL